MNWGEFLIKLKTNRNIRQRIIISTRAEELLQMAISLVHKKIYSRQIYYERAILNLLWIFVVLVQPPLIYCDRNSQLWCSGLLKYSYLNSDELPYERASNLICLLNMDMYLKYVFLLDRSILRVQMFKRDRIFFTRIKWCVIICWLAICNKS